MNELEVCRDLKKKITEIEEKIEDIECRIKYPKGQTFSDAPRSVPNGTSSIEAYMIRKEKLEGEKLMCETQFTLKWNEITRKLTAYGVDNADRYLMYLRFNCNFKWKKCTAIMQNIEGEKWDENRTFRTYRKIVALLQNNT